MIEKQRTKYNMNLFLSTYAINIPNEAVITSSRE
jgi:hypothetical protein